MCRQTQFRARLDVSEEPAVVHVERVVGNDERRSGTTVPPLLRPDVVSKYVSTTTRVVSAERHLRHRKKESSRFIHSTRSMATEPTTNECIRGVADATYLRSPQRQPARACCCLVVIITAVLCAIVS